MNGDWESALLGELVDPDRGISYGIVQPGVHTSNGIPIVRVTDIKDNHIQTDSPLCVDNAIESKYQRTRLRGGEVLLTLVGSVGQSAIVPQELRGWNTARAVAVIPVKDEIGAQWIELCLRSPEIQNFIKTWVTTTVQVTFNLKDVARIPIPLPPKPVRESIADILGALDDKIECNRRINQTLEAMAQALYKHWFVDFGPFRDGEFVDSELGEIPQGWKFGSVYEIANVIYGVPFASEFFNSKKNGLPLIRNGDLKTHEPAIYTTEQLPQQTIIRGGDIVVGMDAEFSVHIWHGPSSLLNQRVCHFQNKPDIPKSYLAKVIQDPLDFFGRSKVGTTVIHLGKSDIDTIKVVIPPAKVLSDFSSKAENLLALQVASFNESRNLARTHDYLLPKLLSGEVEVKATARTV